MIRSFAFYTEASISPRPYWSSYLEKCGRQILYMEVLYTFYIHYLLETAGKSELFKQLR